MPAAREIRRAVDRVDDPQAAPRAAAAFLAEEIVGGEFARHRGGDLPLDVAIDLGDVVLVALEAGRAAARGLPRQRLAPHLAREPCREGKARIERRCVHHPSPPAVMRGAVRRAKRM